MLQHHGLREVKKAAKLSKMRETQKLVKRLKEVRQITTKPEHSKHCG